MLMKAENDDRKCFKNMPVFSNAACRFEMIKMSLVLVLFLSLAVKSDGQSLETKDGRDSRWPLLLVDETLIKKNNGVSLTICEAVKHPDNPVIRLNKPGQPGSIRYDFLGSVYYLDGKFRIWYTAKPGGNSYAESDDGIHWTQPDLGLVSFNGNKKNNLISMPGDAMIFYDEEETDPEKRYKKVVVIGNPNQNGRHALWTLAFSADGLRWNIVKRPQPEVWQIAEGAALAKIGKTWVIQTQMVNPTGRVGYIYSSDDLMKDFSRWEGKIVKDRTKSFMGYESHHGVKTWTRPGLIIGLYGIFCDRHELRDTTCEIGLLLSHDGIKFREPWPLATLIRRGPADSWDSMFLTQGAPSFVNVGDKTFIYYCGRSTGNMGGGNQIGLATLRRDGFGYMGIDIGWTYARKENRTGEFTTVPVCLQDKINEKVLLNVDNLNDRQWIKVELLDGDGKPVPGYTLEDADKITRSGIAVPATWHGNSSLKNIPGNVIHLRIHMQGGQFRRESPQIYAIYFYEPKQIEQ